ncbi:MAG: hypothetical protein RLZZ244_305 [Verrucomicrobiota bacterium]|jgi:transposase
MDEYDRPFCEHYGKMLGVKWVNAGAICAECGKKCTRHDLAPDRRWRHLDAMGFETQIVSRTPRANCGEHGIHQMKVPWADKHSRFTLTFDALAILEFWEPPDIESGQKFFTQWYHEARRSRLEPIHRVAETLKNYLHGLLTYFRHQITNAVTEALNGSIQALKSGARGFRSFENYRTRILFFLGRLDLHPQ